MNRNSFRHLPSIRLILFVAFLIRLGIFGIALWQANDLTIFHSKDTSTYLTPARELLASGNFAVNNVPEVIRTPGYPLFLTIGLFAHNVEVITIALQIIISTISCYLIFLIGKNTTNENSAKLSAILFCFEPLSITYAYYLLSETLFIFLLLLAFYQFVIFIKTDRYLNLIASAMALVAAIYVRPIAYSLIIFWVILIFLKGKQFFRNATFFLLLTFPLLGLWHVRNIIRADYIGFSAVSDVMLYFYHASSIEAQQKGLPLRQIIENKGYYDVKTYYQVHPEQQNWTESQRYEFWSQEGIATIRRDPITFTGVYLKGLGVTLLDPGSADFIRLFNLYPKSGSLTNSVKSEGLIKIIIENKLLVFISLLFLIYLICIYFFSLIGVRDLFKTDNSSGRLLLLTCAYLFLLSGGVVAIARLRAPIMPFLLIIVGHGIALTFHKLKGNSFSVTD